MPSIRVNDINVYYELRGEGEPLVLITGLANDVTNYEHIIALLSQKYRVLAFDNRGAGRTDKPDSPYSMEQMADDTRGLMGALDIGQAHVIGVSMGGRIAMALALQHPGTVKSLILVSTFARPVARGGPLPEFREGPGKYPQPRYAFLRQLQASRSYDCSGRLGDIRVPALILHGMEDGLVPLPLAEEIHASIRGSEMAVFPGGHVFFMKKPEEFCKAVCRFLAGLDNF